MSDWCSNFENLLFEPEEELSETDLTKLAAHILQCENCRVERELFLESWSALGELEPEFEATPVRARVWERIREEEKLPPPLLEPETAASFMSVAQKLTVAGFALLLGFGLGRGIKATPEATTAAEVGKPAVAVRTEEKSQEDFIDPAMIELASQEGFSMEIFPETNSFTPLDQEMRTALASSDEERVWVQQDRGMVVPVQYISQGSAPR